MGSREQIVNRQILRWWEEQKAQAAARTTREGKSLLRPVVTISRQTGSAGALIAEIVSRRLGYQLFDRELIHAMAERAGVQEDLVDALDERRGSGVDLWVEGVIRGRQFDNNDFLRALVRTVYLLARHGSAVIVGRGGNFILEGERAFHARIIAPMAERQTRVMRTQDLSAEDAEALIRRRDREQAEFMQKQFNRNIDDPSAYDLVLNTSIVPPEVGAETILEVLARLDWGRPSDPEFNPRSSKPSPE